MENTKFTEQRYITSDPALMYNRYFAANLYRTYTESFLDDETGEVVDIERRELLFERGTHINGDVIAKLRFYLSTGDVKEVDVSNQQRRGMFSKGAHLRPYIAKVEVGCKKNKILLYASGLQNVIDIIQDYGELTFSGLFDITTAKEIDFAEIFIDTLQPIDLTAEYLKDSISMREWAAAEKSQAPAEGEKASLGLWRLDLEITERFDKREELFDRSFIIKTSSVERALAAIEVQLYKKQEQSIADGVTSDKASYTLKIKAASPMKIDFIIPTEFSLAHNKTE